MRTFLRYLRREEAIDDDPGSLVPTPKREVRMPAHLSEDGNGARCSTRRTATTPLGRRDEAILELFYASGLRLSELAGLDLDDVNLSSEDGAGAGQGRQGTAGAVQQQHRDGAPRVSEGPGDACERRRQADRRSRQ